VNDFINGTSSLNDFRNALKILHQDTFWGASSPGFLMVLNQLANNHVPTNPDIEANFRFILRDVNTQNVGQRIEQFYNLLAQEKKCLEASGISDKKIASPGNSAYRDIYQWWEQLNGLHIGKALDRNQLTLASKRTDDKSNAQLYELWIVLELLHMLDDLHSIKSTDLQIEGDQIRFRFQWNERDFIFTYHRQSLRENELLTGWNNVPATNTRYSIEREHPAEVRIKDSVVWRESPITLDTSYESTNNGYTVTLQKLLGEMRLQGTKHAVLFAPMLPEPALEEPYTRAYRDTSMYTEGMSYNLKDPSIRLCKLVPGMDIKLLQDRLKALLDDVTSRETFPERTEPACHGIIHHVLKPGRKTQKSEAKDISPCLNIKWGINEQLMISVTLSKQCVSQITGVVQCIRFP
jgi:hypothetical protein